MNSIPRTGANAPSNPAVSAASLPPELRQLVDRVLKRCALWPAERSDVEAELAAHFADGLASGQTVEQLVAQFGDPDAAAGLIRRAKIRTRSRTWHARQLLVRTTAAAAGMAIAIYAAMALRFYVGTPTIKRNFREEINAPIVAISEKDRAWNKYREALLAIELPSHAVPDNGKTSDAFSSPEAARVNQRAIKLIREGAALPALGYVVDANENNEFLQRQTARLAGQKDWQTQPFYAGDGTEPLYGILLPQLGTLRSFARLLAQDVDVAIERGDATAVSADLVALARLSVQARETKFLICDLVSLAIGDLAMAKVRDVLTRGPDLLTSAALAEIAQALKAVGPRQQLVRFDSELLSFDDILQRSFTDDGRGDGRLTFAGIRLLSQMSSSGESAATGAGAIAALPLSVVAGPGRKELRAMYESYLAQNAAWAEKPLWSRAPATDFDEFSKINSSSLAPRAFIALVMPAFRNSVFTADRFDASRAATLTVIAIEQFRRKSGHPPSTLEQLVPEYLNAIPLDLADGLPLRYRNSGASYVLYSLGSDKKDNGGVIPKSEADLSVISRFGVPSDREIGAADWVFFPWTKLP